MTRAEAWRQAKEADLKARILLRERILEWDRTEVAELRALDGEALAARYASESPEELERLRKQDAAFHEALEALFEAGIWSGGWDELLKSA